MSAPTAPVRTGDIVAGKYRIERVLGAGAMGVVVVATHVHLEQKVAIKFLLPEVAKSTEAVARFAREARAAAKIQSEHVARVLDVATHESGVPYMVMEYLEGRDLEQTREEHGSLPVEKVVDYVLQALEALAEAHVAGIVHRDLKPANMFLARRADGSSVVKILDFGISKLASDKSAKLTHESAQMGSPLYMSPEQLQRSPEVDARTDIWAIGVILQELVTGTAPFAADSLAEIVAGILSLPPLRMRLHKPEIPEGLEQVVLRCLEKSPDKRFPDVAKLAVALAPFGPERCAVSTERIVRVVSGRKENLAAARLFEPRSRDPRRAGRGVDAPGGAGIDPLVVADLRRHGQRAPRSPLGRAGRDRSGRGGKCGGDRPLRASNPAVARPRSRR